MLGHVYSVLHLNRSFQDLPGSWYARMEHFNILDHGIHYIDLSRYFSGRTPERVKATTTMVPGQAAVTPMVYSIQLEYAPQAQLMATLHFNNIVQTGALHRYEWLVDGTDGSAVASQSELTVSTRRREQRLVTAIQGRWFPDAFGEHGRAAAGAGGGAPARDVRARQSGYRPHRRGRGAVFHHRRSRRPELMPPPAGRDVLRSASVDCRPACTYSTGTTLHRWRRAR